jgi:hypothetical protein
MSDFNAAMAGVIIGFFLAVGPSLIKRWLDKRQEPMMFSRLPPKKRK